MSAMQEELLNGSAEEDDGGARMSRVKSRRSVKPKLRAKAKSRAPVGQSSTAVEEELLKRSREVAMVRDSNAKTKADLEAERAEKALLLEQNKRLEEERHQAEHKRMTEMAEAKARLLVEQERLQLEKEKAAQNKAAEELRQAKLQQEREAEELRNKQQLEDKLRAERQKHQAEQEQKSKTDSLMAQRLEMMEKKQADLEKMEAGKLAELERKQADMEAAHKDDVSKMSTVVANMSTVQAVSVRASGKKKQPDSRQQELEMQVMDSDNMMNMVTDAHKQRQDRSSPQAALPADAAAARKKKNYERCKVCLLGVLALAVLAAAGAYIFSIFSSPKETTKIIVEGSDLDKRMAEQATNDVVHHLESFMAQLNAQEQKEKGWRETCKKSPSKTLDLMTTQVIYMAPAAATLWTEKKDKDKTLEPTMNVPSGTKVRVRSFSCGKKEYVNAKQLVTNGKGEIVENGGRFWITLRTDVQRRTRRFLETSEVFAARGALLDSIGDLVKLLDTAPKGSKVAASASLKAAEALRTLPDQAFIEFPGKVAKGGEEDLAQLEKALNMQRSTREATMAKISVVSAGSLPPASKIYCKVSVWGVKSDPQELGKTDTSSPAPHQEPQWSYSKQASVKEGSQLKFDVWGQLSWADIGQGIIDNGTPPSTNAQDVKKTVKSTFKDAIIHSTSSVHLGGGELLVPREPHGDGWESSTWSYDGSIALSDEKYSHAVQGHKLRVRVLLLFG